MILRILLKCIGEKPTGSMASMKNARKKWRIFVKNSIKLLNLTVMKLQKILLCQETSHNLQRWHLIEGIKVKKVVVRRMTSYEEDDKINK